MNQSAFKEEHFSFRQVSFNGKPEVSPKALLEWMAENPILDLGPQSTHSESGKIFQELRFSLKGQASCRYPLLKGIVLSGRPDNLTLQADDSSRSFLLKFDRAHEIAAYQYVSRVLRMIQEEIRFKQVL